MCTALIQPLSTTPDYCPALTKKRHITWFSKVFEIQNEHIILTQEIEKYNLFIVKMEKEMILLLECHLN